MQGMKEMWVQSLGREDPLEKEMATHAGILAWKIPWQTSLEDCSPWGCKELDMTEGMHKHTHTHTHTHTHMPETPFYTSLLSRAGEGNGSPLQYSCLENPMERGTWQATFHAVARVGHNLATKSPVSRAETNHWAQWFFHCGSQTSSTSITGEFGRHANSQVHQVLRNEKL